MRPIYTAQKKIKRDILRTEEKKNHADICTG